MGGHADTWLTRNSPGPWPMRDGRDALLVNWLEIEIVDASGKLTYRNSFVTDLPVDGRKRKAIRPLSTITSSGAPSNLGSTGCALNAHPCLATNALNA